MSDNIITSNPIPEFVKQTFLDTYQRERRPVKPEMYACYEWHQRDEITHEGRVSIRTGIQRLARNVARNGILVTGIEVQVANHHALKDGEKRVEDSGRRRCIVTGHPTSDTTEDARKFFSVEPI